MRLSKNFSLEELTASQEATRLGIDNTPSPEVVSNLVILCGDTLEPIRMVLNKPILVSSGYRSPELNTAIGGSKLSDHMKGLACDFISPSFSNPLDVCKAIEASGIPFGQLIAEFGKWVHISHGTQRECLTAVKQDGKTVYLKGLK